MAPQRIDAHGLGVAEPLFQKGFARGPAILVRIPILIERAEHVEGPAIEKQPAAARLEATKSDAFGDAVDGLAVDEQRHGDFIEVRRVGRPEFDLVERHAQVENVGVHGEISLGDASASAEIATRTVAGVAVESAPRARIA